MSKIHFYYGVMGSSKSAELGINAFNFNRTGNKWVAIKPAKDDRDSETDIVSRIGVKTHAKALQNLDNFKPKHGTQFILIDEVQFFYHRDTMYVQHYMILHTLQLHRPVLQNNQ